MEPHLLSDINYLRDLATRLRRVAATHVDGYDIDRVHDIASTTEPARDRLAAALPELANMRKRLGEVNPGARIEGAMVAFNPAGSGQIGPTWAIDPFLKDVDTLLGKAADPEEG